MFTIVITSLHQSSLVYCQNCVFSYQSTVNGLRTKVPYGLGFLGSRCWDKIGNMKELVGSNAWEGKEAEALGTSRAVIAQWRALPSGPCFGQASGKLKQLKALTIRGCQPVLSWRGTSVAHLSLSDITFLSSMVVNLGGLVVIQQTLSKHRLCTRH